MVSSLALGVAITAGACGGLSNSTTPDSSTDPNAKLLDELCHRIQGMGCSPFPTATQCLDLFRSELDSATLVGCQTEAITFDQCFLNAGFVCTRGVLFSNGGCEPELDALTACAGAG